MKLSYDKLIHHLALQWFDTICNRPVDKLQSNRTLAETLEFEQTSQNVNKEVQQLEDEILMLLHVNGRKGKCNDNDESNRRSKKRGKYDSNIIMFTNPETGDRHVLTYHYTIWWNTYCVDPKPHKKSWAREFRQGFRLPYESYLDLVRQCECCDKFQQWLRNNINLFILFLILAATTFMQNMSQHHLLLLS